MNGNSMSGSKKYNIYSQCYDPMKSVTEYTKRKSPSARIKPTQGCGKYIKFRTYQKTPTAMPLVGYIGNSKPTAHSLMAQTNIFAGKWSE